MLLLPHCGGTERIAFLCFSSCCPGTEEQMEGTGDRPFLTQISASFTVFSRLQEFEEKTVTSIDSLFPLDIHMYTYIHYINAFKGSKSMKNNYVNVNTF